MPKYKATCPDCERQLVHIDTSNEHGAYIKCPCGKVNHVWADSEPQSGFWYRQQRIDIQNQRGETP